jgi:lipopolysaccharide biosynthesis glycosyltransferase
MNKTLDVFIGYDPREAVAYHVCANSIIRNSSVPVNIHPIALSNMRDYQEEHTDASNQFIYSRFLVPHLMDHKGVALFVDGDMIVRDGVDIAELFALADLTKAVQVVKHDYQTKAKTKYLGAPNESYPRKQWSAVTLWNCGSAIHNKLTPEFVQKATGAELHRFTWVPDDRIGELPIEWNWLVDEFGENPDAKLLHWTLGTPCFNEREYATAPMSAEWHRERMLANYSLQK